MATHNVMTDDALVARPETRPRGIRRRVTETNAAFKTTERYAYIAVLVGLMIAGLATSTGSGHDDRLASNEVWLYSAILTVGYMASRALAKSGSRGPYTDTDDR